MSRAQAPNFSMGGSFQVLHDGTNVRVQCWKCNAFIKEENLMPHLAGCEGMSIVLEESGIPNSNRAEIRIEENLASEDSESQFQVEPCPHRMLTPKIEGFSRPSARDNKQSTLVEKDLEKLRVGRFQGP